MKKTQTKIEVRSILRPSQINRLQSQRTVGSSESGSETISVEKYLRDFKSQKSQAKSQRSTDSLNRADSVRPCAVIYESFTNRYPNHSSILKTLNEGSSHLQPTPQPKQKIVTQPFKINVSAHRLNPECNRSAQRISTNDSSLLTERLIQKSIDLLDKFEAQTRSSSFQSYIQKVAILSDNLSQVSKESTDKTTKELIDKFKHIFSNISRKCLIRLSEKEDELESTTDQNFRIMSDLVMEQIKNKYDRKIQKLTQIIQQKEQKQREVNKLLYYLRMSGIDIESIWNHYVNQQKAAKDHKKYQKCRTQYH